MKRTTCYLLIGILFVVCGCNSARKDDPAAYTEDWVSLANYNEQPAWFQDAKFGIYFHWGVYSVPAFGDEWYPRHMHFENRKEYQHHVNTYGALAEFGLLKLISDNY